MLHECLLALSGYSSPLLQGENGIPGVSLAEASVLSSLGTLSQLHRRLKQHLDTIITKHQSMICRATATSLRHTHLERFQQKVLDVEANILRRDSSAVGAYDIVPLAYVVAQFDEWQRRMAWYWELVTLMIPIVSGKAACSGPALIDRLRNDVRTGFPDVEEAAIELSRVAELAWLKQLASWLLSGTINPYGKEDFFLQGERNSEDQIVIRQQRDLLPKFVSNATATSMLFIGKTLQQLKQSQSAPGGRADNLVSTHMKLLTDLTLPIVPAQLNRNISAMRTSLSRNVLQDLLPLQTTHIALEALRRYFLLSDSDFATCLITEAEWRLESRWQSMDRLAQMDPLKALQGLSIKDAETAQVLRQTWKRVTQENEDDVLEFARKHTTLSTAKKTLSRPATADSVADVRFELSPVVFNDLMFGSPATLSLQIKAPLDLFLSALDIGIYSHVNGYLLSLRRAQLRLENLWRRNPGRGIKSNQPNVPLRRSWATSSAVLLLLSELSSYLMTGVVIPCFEHYQGWTNQPQLADGHTQEEGVEGVQRDPETLAAGHRTFLDSLAYALLITDLAYTKEIRSLLGAVEQLSSLFIRLLDARKEDSDQPEQSKLQDALTKACHSVETQRRKVVTRLREVHQRRIGSDRYLDIGGRNTGGYEPLKAGGLDHLLMKLEYEQSSESDDRWSD